jgi:hypothetical protein
MQPGSYSFDSATLEIVDKSLRLVKRHRKQRHAKLRDMTREEEDAEGLSGFRGGKGRWAGSSRGTLCPICMKMVPGDQDVVEAHVDTCLAHEARMQEQREREMSERLRREEEHLGDVDIDGHMRVLATDGASLRGLGFSVRDHSQQDVDDEIDVDGEDETAFGVAQFSEGDIVNPFERQMNEDEEVDIQDEPEASVPSSSNSDATRSTTLRDFAVAGRVIETDTAKSNTEVQGEVDEVMGLVEIEELSRAVERAKKSGDTNALVEALEKKLSALVCLTRITY